MTPSDREMTCAQAQGRIEAYVDGDLPREEATTLESHLLSCATCAEELALAKRVKRTLKDLPRQSCPESVVDAVLARAGIQKTPVTHHPALRGAPVRWYARAWRPAALAATVLAVVSALFVLNRPQSPPQVLSQEELALAEQQVKWTLAYVDEITRRSVFTATDDVFERRVIPPIQRALVGIVETEGEAAEQPER